MHTGEGLRVEELAVAAGVSVDTVRYYQARGLLPPPRRVGRIALYDTEHRTRLQRIRTLQDEGLTLATIGRLLNGELDTADRALAGAVARLQSPPPPPEGPDEALTLEELAAAIPLPLGLLLAVEREGLLRPADHGYGQADVAAARAGLRLLELGLPLPELLDLARRHHAHVRAVAEEATRLFDEHVRRPLRDDGTSDSAAAERLVEAFDAILPATLQLVAHHFERTLLAVALEHIEAVGADAELAAIAAHPPTSLAPTPDKKDLARP